MNSDASSGVMTSQMEIARPLPWSVSDVRSALLPVVLGFVLLGWAWWDASGTGKLDDQTRSVVFAVLGGGAVVAGAIAWLATGRRALRIRRRAVVELLEKSALLGPGKDAVDIEREPAALVIVKGTSHYHRADCLLVQDKNVQAHSARTGKREPCPMCEP